MPKVTGKIFLVAIWRSIIMEIYLILYSYDFDSDGLISKEDVKTVLYYLPFYRDNQESGAYN